MDLKVSGTVGQLDGMTVGYYICIGVNNNKTKKSKMRGIMKILI